jgi:hypothetical protein
MVPLIDQFRNRTSTVVAAAIAVAALCWCTLPVRADPPREPAPDAPRYDYPTSARVEYVQECIAKNGGNLADLYKCSCAIDRIADHLSYDDFVEAGTFARYATLPGEGGGEFRDPEHARERAKLYRSTETDAYRSCGLKVAAPAR